MRGSSWWRSPAGLSARSPCRLWRAAPIHRLQPCCPIARTTWNSFGPSERPMTQLHAAIQEVTERIKAKSADSRRDYLARMQEARSQKPQRAHISCGNLAHGFAGCGTQHKELLAGDAVPNIGIVSAYNDMLSAHQPYGDYPALIKQAADEVGAVAQFA